MFGIKRKKSTNPTEQKAQSVRHLISYQAAAGAVWTPRNYQALAREGYMRNAVVYRCVRMICEAAASVPMDCVTEPVFSLLHKPNMEQSGTEFFEALYGHLLLAGNGYLEMVDAGDDLHELHVLRPDRVQVLVDKTGRPSGWEYTVAGRKIKMPRDLVQGRNPVLHIKLFHPDNDHYGLSPLEAAACAVDIHNAGAAWNKAMLDNAARPSGALVFQSKAGEQMSQEQFERLKQELENTHQGASNAGRPLLLEGGLDWRPMALSPTDMDFLDSRNASAREIALAFGVPPMLLGIPGDNTYANYREANRAFWRQTVLPLSQKTAQALQSWLQAWFGQQVSIRACQKEVPALAEDQSMLWKRVNDAGFLSDEEKRELVGLPSKTNQRRPR
ncbi:Gene Transfer Agent portal protein [hydrothermal vent metagenome]|uniref:Gene Transfer Agent portal protein n=1 Tax=hydrothermal vent metagenome TaxID=652676 RepID=A0A3B0SYK1_9ZZZZ